MGEAVVSETVEVVNIDTCNLTRLDGPMPYLVIALSSKKGSGLQLTDLGCFLTFERAQMRARQAANETGLSFAVVRAVYAVDPVSLVTAQKERAV